jgi:hypothetical protein
MQLRAPVTEVFVSANNAGQRLFSHKSDLTLFAT